MKSKAPFIAILLIATGIGGYFFYKSRQVVENGSIVLSGVIEVVEVNTGFKSAGRIESLSTDEGRKVTKGDVIAKLESNELGFVVEQNKAALEEAQHRLAEFVAGSRPQEISQADAGVTQARADLDKAKKDLERAKYLFSNGAIASQKLEDAKRVFDVSDSLYKKALENRSLIKEGPRKETIAAAEFRVRQADAALKISDQRLADATLRAPVDGVILKKYLETGETAQAGAPVFDIGDLANPWARVYIRETDLGKVKLGQKAAVTTDSYPGKKYDGEISQISSEAQFTPKSIQTHEERVKLVFAMKVAVKNVNQELKPGMPVDVRLLNDGQ